MLDIQYLNVFPSEGLGLSAIKKVDYAPIHQHGYGRMDSNFSLSGLCTSRLASCIAIVIHCHKTSRTTLSHSPNYMIIANEFYPIINWVLNGEQDALVSVVILRGAFYNEITTVEFGHAGFVSDFKRFCDKFFEGIPFDITDWHQPCLSGSVIVDKSSKICIIKSDTPGFIEILNPVLYNEYPNSHVIQQVLCGNLDKDQYRPTKIRLQYDMDKYVRSFQFTDATRELIRSVKDSTFDPTLYEFHILSYLEVVKQKVNVPCECCFKHEAFKCARCKGAWYCSATCQKADFKKHKGWCKAHEVKK